MELLNPFITVGNANIVKSIFNRTARILQALTLATISTTAPVAFSQIHSSGYDTPSMIDFESTEVSVSESATNVILHLFRTGEFRTISRVDYSTVEETASEGEDYRPTGGTLVFQPGEGYKTITIPILQDNDFEDPEWFHLQLSTSDNRIILVRNSAKITIEESTNQVAAIPRLKIESAADGGVKLSWPKTSSNYVLECAASCVSGPWEQVNLQPQLNGTMYEVTQPSALGYRVYRLKGDF